MKSGKISYLHTLIGWVFGVPWTAACAFYALCLFWITRSGARVHHTSRGWSRILLRMTGIRVEVTGLENIPENQPVLIVSNHQSMYDILVFSGYYPKYFSWIAKKELFRIPFLGPAMHAANYIPIDRENKEKSLKSLEDAADRLRDNSVLIFPEGTRSRTGAVGQFKFGAVILASISGNPILPVTITNSFERLPPEKFGIVPGTIRMIIDPVIETKGLNRRELFKILKEIRARIESRVNASSEIPAADQSGAV